VVDGLLLALVAGELLELGLSRPSAASVSVVVLMVLAPAALLLRRRVPLPSVLVSCAAFAALIQLVPATLSTTFLALLFAVGVFGTLVPMRVAVSGLVGVLAIGVEGAWLDRYGGGVGDFAMSAAIMVGLWGCGLLLARGARHAAADAERIVASERARSDAVRQERARLTRELHDVVAHGLTVLVVQAVAAQEDLDHDAPLERVRGRLAASEEVARESLQELRTLLGILGTAHDGVAAGAGTDAVRALVQRLRATGLDVALDVDERRPVDDSLELTLYRVVQEALTNAYKHGAGDAQVRVASGPDGVEVVVTNRVRPGAPALTGSGRGLAGLRERAALHGGSLEAQGREGVFRLECALPAVPERQPARFEP
jgi:signal transduction histidine kinase